MLSYALAIVVAVSSLAVFLTAFVMSDIHRQDDFLWSGVGLFYALVLWFCARNITGAVLLGQAAAATLLVSYSWQTLKLRKAVANPEQAAEITDFSVLRALNNLLSGKKSQPQVVAPPVEPTTEKVKEEIAIPNSVSATQTIAPEPDNSGVLDKFFGKKKPTATNTEIDKNIDDEPAKESEKATVSVVPVEPKPEPVIESAQPTADNTGAEAIATEPEVVEPLPQPQIDVEEKSTVEPPQTKDLVETNESQLEQLKEDIGIDLSSESEVKVENKVISEPVETLETNPTIDNFEQLSVETEEKTIFEPVETLETNPTIDNSEQLSVETEDKSVADSVDDTATNPTVDNSEQLSVETQDKSVADSVDDTTTNPTIDNFEKLELKTDDKPVFEPVKPYDNTPLFGNFDNDLESEKIENKTVESETNPSIIVPENPEISVAKESETLAAQTPETQNDEAETKNASQVDTDFNLADFSTEDNESYQQNDPVAKPSSLDSLETVEVAEVLEALPEDRDRDLDKSNIIEVTTTEIDITTEVKKIDSNPKENLNDN